MALSGLVGLCLIASATTVAPAWDLERDAGDVSAVFRRDGSVPLDTAHAFKVPHTAIGDSTAFTMEMKIRCDDPRDKTQLSLIRQKTADTGWGLDICLSAALGSLVDLTVNDASFMAGWFHSKPREEHTFVVTARKGLTVVYFDGRCLARFMKLITPNLEPIEVGRAWSRRFPEMKGVRLTSLKFWGPELEFYLPGESREYASGFKGGPGWMVNCPIEDPSRPLPRILCYGDSILSGYGELLRSKLQGKAYVYLWRSFVGSAQGAGLDLRPFVAATGVAKFDRVVFNNGLHSLHWTESAVSDDLLRSTQRRIYEGLRTGAPRARFYWLSTTPHTAGGDKSTGKVVSTGNLDHVVQRINRLTADELGRDGVDVIDAYSLLRVRLDLAAGDGYHWTGAGYGLLADVVARAVLANTASASTATR